MVSKAVFLDRDNTLIHDQGYLSHPDQVMLIDGVPEALNDLRAIGYQLVVVTNQSAVARGIVTEPVLHQIHDRMEALLAGRGVRLDRIYYCPYHPDGVVERYRKASDWRKPNPGMLLTAAKEMDIDLDRSWCIGDSFSDVEAGVKAGCKTVLIDGSSPPKRPSPGQPSPDYVAVNLREAVNIIKRFHRDSAMDSSQNKFETVHVNKAHPSTPPLTDRPDTTAGFKSPPPAAPGPRPAHEEDLGEDRTEQLLDGILGQLRDMQRGQDSEEFSVMRLLAGIAQASAIACLVVGLWKLTAPNVAYEPVLTALGFATVLQVMALTFYDMNRR